MADLKFTVPTLKGRLSKPTAQAPVVPEPVVEPVVDEVPEAPEAPEDDEV